MRHIAVMKWPDTIKAGEIERHEPLVRRVLAPNASPYTYTGTQTWIVGNKTDVAIIDPGPVGSGHSVGDPADIHGEGHVEAILRAVGDAKVTAILCTHTHRDHSPAAAPLKVATGAPIAVPGDMNADGVVDGSDIGALLRVWGQAHPVADFTGDGTVDGRDLAYMLAHWTN